ncbi:hypothetical protein, partial [Propionivibrio sp.]|uniref:hypothetical protein n=1 Tax=Propionivibrio sp. TaxID=2212460 RepID=UPI00263040C8
MAVPTGSTAVIKVEFPVGIGQDPEFISAAGIRTTTDGIKLLRFLLTNGKDVNAGLATVTVSLAPDGSLTKNTGIKRVEMSGVIAGDTRINDPYKLNIQRAQSPVLIVKDGVEYALVADFFVDLNEPDETTGDGFFRSAPQMGGKVGIIKDPFGKAEYLGATTPIINGTLQRLHITEDGKSLMADLGYFPAIVDDPSTYVPMKNGLLTWNLPDLIAAAEANSINKQNSKKPIPIDRVNGTQVVAPVKQEIEGAPWWLWIADIESSHDSVDLTNKAITLGSTPESNIIKFKLKEAASEVLLTISTFPPGDGLFEGDVKDFARVFTRKLTEADIGSFAAGEKSYQIPTDVYLTAGQHYYWGVEAISVTGQKSRESGTLDSAPILDETNTHFAGVTIITHDSNIKFWASANPESELEEEIKLGKAIAAQGGGEVFVYLPETMGWKYLGDPNVNKTPADVLGHPLVLIANWILDSSVVDSGFSEAAADGMFAGLIKLENDTGHRLFNSPLHFIGFGRGASVNSEVTQRMGKYFPEVKDIQFTTLDPHDFKQPSLNLITTLLIGDLSTVAGIVQWFPNLITKAIAKIVGVGTTWIGRILDMGGFGSLKYGDYLDPVINRWSNIGFFDNYYQQLGKPEVWVGSGLGRLTFTVNGREIVSDPSKNIVGADVNINLDSMAGFNHEDVMWSPWIFKVGTNQAHFRVLGWYYGTANLATNRYRDSSWLHWIPQYIYRSPSDRRNLLATLEAYNLPAVVANGLFGTNSGSFEKGNAWYRAGEINVGETGASAESDKADQRSQEGTGIGWGYSYLGGGATKRPVTPLVGASVEDGGASTQQGNTKEAIPGVFDGDFQSARNPVYGRYGSIQTGFEIPGWSFQGGSGSWFQGITHQSFYFDKEAMKADLPNINQALWDEFGFPDGTNTRLFAWTALKTVVTTLLNPTSWIRLAEWLATSADGFWGKLLKNPVMTQLVKGLAIKYGWNLATNVMPDILKYIQQKWLNVKGVLSGAGDVLTHDWQYFPPDKTTLLFDVSTPKQIALPTEDGSDLFTVDSKSVPLSVSGVLLVDFKDANGVVLSTESVPVPVAAGVTRTNVRVTIPAALRGKVGQFSFRVADVRALQKAGNQSVSTVPWETEIDNVRLETTPADVLPITLSLTLEKSEINEGSSAVLIGEFTNPSKPAQTHIVIVDWGNGEARSITLDPGVTTFSMASLFLDDNPSGTSSDFYKLKAWIFDGEGGEGSGTIMLHVHNVEPTVDAEFVSPSIAENTTAVLQLHVNDIGLEDSFTVTVDWGDGQVTTETLAFDDRNSELRHVYRDDDPSGTPRDDYTVQIRVEDDDLGVGDMTTVITVVNQNPEIQIGGGRDLKIGDTFAPYASVIDPSPDDVLEYHWEIFDPDGALIDESFTLAAPTVVVTQEGVYSARLSVTDDDLGEAEVSVNAVVWPPAVDPRNPTKEEVLATLGARGLFDVTLSSVFGSIYREGDSITFGGNAYGVELDNCYVEVNWGDGDIERLSLTDNVAHTRGAFSGKHTIRDDNPTGTSIDNMTISARLMRIPSTGPDLQLANWQHTIAVENVPPELNDFTVTPTATAGEFEFGVSVQDPGVGDTFTYVWNFGNGIIETTTTPTLTRHLDD